MTDAQPIIHTNGGQPDLRELFRRQKIENYTFSAFAIGIAVSKWGTA
jgi:hypothetical protein